MLYGIGATEGHYNSPPNGFVDEGLELWSPLNLSNLWAWYTVEGFNLSDGDSVAQWNDLSGNGRHVSQGTAGDQPTYRVDEVGMPYVDFDHGPFLSMSNSFSTPITTFAVCYFRSLDGNLKVGGGGSFYIFSLNGGNIATYNGSHFTVGHSARLGWNVGTSVTDSANSELYLNGELLGTGSAGTSSISNWTIGADNNSGVRPMDGGIREILMFDAHLSQALIEGVSRRLMAKWKVNPSSGAAGV